MKETTHVYRDGELVDVIEVDVPDPEPQPLTENEQLATLLAVKGVITTDEAAAVTKRPKADLVAEAEAWAVAAEVAPVKP